MKSLRLGGEKNTTFKTWRFVDYFVPIQFKNSEEVFEDAKKKLIGIK